MNHALHRKFIAAAMLSSAVVAMMSVASAEEVSIRYMDRTTSAEYSAHTKWLADTFNEAHKGEIKVVFEGVPDETYKAKIFNVLRSPNPPDIFYSWEGGRAKFLIDAGFVEPLDRYYDQYGWTKELNSSGVALATFGDHKYFVPTMMAGSIVWYRPDIFKANGIEVPKTWDELMAAADKLKAAGITPFILANQKRWPAQFMWSGIFVNKYGVEAYDDLIAGKLPWTDAKVVDVFQMMKNLQDGGYFEQGSNGLDTTPAVVPFSQGKAAMWYQGTFMSPQFLGENGAPKFPLSYFPLPPIGDKPAVLEAFAENTLMMNAHSQNKDAAAKFLDWVISVEAQTHQVYDAKMVYPANVKVSLDKQPEILQALGKTVETPQARTFMHPDHALPDVMADPYLDALQSVLVGVVTPQQAAEQIEQAMQNAAK